MTLTNHKILESRIHARLARVGDGISDLNCIWLYGSELSFVMT